MLKKSSLTNADKIFILIILNYLPTVVQYTQISSFYVSGMRFRADNLMTSLQLQALQYVVSWLTLALEIQGESK